MTSRRVSLEVIHVLEFQTLKPDGKGFVSDGQRVTTEPLRDWSERTNEWGWVIRERVVPYVRHDAELASADAAALSFLPEHGENLAHAVSFRSWRNRPHGSPTPQETEDALDEARRKIRGSKSE